VPEEAWIAADEILREYAELARAEIEAQEAEGMLDAAAMERIKRDTHVQAIKELKLWIPEDVFMTMFPAEIEQ
jgi:hypothetical protein